MTLRKQMGSRLRPVPDKIFECLIEVAAPLSDKEDGKIISYYPDNYEDVDVFKEVVPFCFPFARDAEMVDAVQHFAFVLTDADGLYRFGFCRYPPKGKTCLCILSDLAAFEMFYGILNTLAELEDITRNERLTSKQFLDLVLESQVPEPGTKFTVSDPGTGWIKQYNYPDPEKLPSIPENRNLTEYFSAVNPNNMIALFASMMFERRIILTSKKLSLLTACTYSASLLLYPMHWQHVFIPVLPPSFVDYCCAPMPFLFGVHSSLMDRVRDMPLDEVVILDIDKNDIELGHDDIVALPSEAISRLNNALKKNTIAIGDYVARAFLSAVVALIGGYRDALKLSSDTIVFEEEMFVNSRPHMKSFLENLLKLQLFEQFIHHRLAQLNSGEAIDDVFEEQVGLQTDNDSKWVSQYKNWMKNRKRDGTQLLNNLSGKTEKATYKAKKFIYAGMKNMKSHGKNGFKEAMRGFKEKSKNFNNSKDTEQDFASYDNTRHPSRTNSLPLKKSLSTEPDRKMAARKSIGVALHNHLNSPPSPTKSPRPSRPPPRVPSDTPKAPLRPPPPRPANPPLRRPSPPPPYQSPAVLSASDELKLRPSMVRNPGEPGVKDLINFYDSQEDLSAPSKESSDPFADFKDFDYTSDPQTSLHAESSHLRTNGLSNSDQNLPKNDGLFTETMSAVSDETRNFLRNSRLMMESENAKNFRNSNPSLASEFYGSPRLQRKAPLKRAPVKKTLREIALEQKTGNGRVPLAHASSAPSLLDLDRTGVELHRASSDNSGNHDVSVNVELLAQVGLDDSRTNDPFLELSQRHKRQQRVATGAKFE